MGRWATHRRKQVVLGPGYQTDWKPTTRNKKHMMDILTRYAAMHRVEPWSSTAKWVYHDLTLMLNWATPLHASAVALVTPETNHRRNLLFLCSTILNE